jgi:hypothetical protein
MEQDAVRTRSIRPIILALIVFSAASAQRICQLANSPDCAWPHSAYYEGDATLYARFAQSLQLGSAFEYDLPIHSPGVAYLLSWMWDGRPETGLTVAKLFWCVCGSASCAILFVILLQWCGELVALTTAMLAAASFGLTVQSCSLNADAPYTLLLLASVLLVMQFNAVPGRRGIALLGLLSGLAVLFRPEHTLLVLMFAAYLAIRWRRRPVYLLILAASFLFVPLPWNIRSYRAIQRFNTVEPTPIDYASTPVRWTPEAIEYLRTLPAFAREANFKFISYLAQQRRQTVDRTMVEKFFRDEMGYIPRPLWPFVFVSNQAALSFALANCAQADGGFSTALLDDASATGVFSFASPRHLRLYQDGFAIGLRWMRNNPGDAMRLMGRKLSIFASGLVGGFSPWNATLSPGGLRRAADQVATPISEHPIWSTVLLLFAALGLAFSLKSDLGRIFALVLLYKLLVTVAFYGYARQSTSVLPVFYYFLAVGVLDATGLACRLLGRSARNKPIRAATVREWSTLDQAVSFASESSPGHTGSSKVVTVLGATLWLLLVGSAVLFSTKANRYDVVGPIDAAEYWGPGAFESQRTVRVSLLR